ncbi:hypothetical protein FS749_003037 [Ceratobasidium sp. UAMH 11750]|nr:hypothetical protein FS749_003037 [Ceratobasidium sp. UAMH 11750]
MESAPRTMCMSISPLVCKTGGKQEISSIKVVGFAEVARPRHVCAKVERFNYLVIDWGASTGIWESFDLDPPGRIVFEAWCRVVKREGGGGLGWFRRIEVWGLTIQKLAIARFSGNLAR